MWANAGQFIVAGRHMEEIIDQHLIDMMQFHPDVMSAPVEHQMKLRHADFFTNPKDMAMLGTRVDRHDPMHRLSITLLRSRVECGADQLLD